MRFNDFSPPGTITGSELALRLAFIRQLERDTGRKMPTTIEGNIRAWENREPRALVYGPASKGRRVIMVSNV